jgi:phosphatidylglycerol:prolipoprotein diacylglycerol transferase
VHPVLFHFGAILIPAYGAVAALGVLLALLLAQRTARIVGANPNLVWNLSVIAIFAALGASRLLLVLVNLGDLRQHPRWMLGLAMIHHPLLAGVGALAGLAAAISYTRWQKMPLLQTADALAAPLALGLAFEQIGSLLAGSGYGTEAGAGIAARWAVTYSHPLAALWSGTPLGVALHPVQAYAALADLTLALLILLWLTGRRRAGDVSGMALMGFGVALYVTEFWRDPGGRGALFGGALDGPQAASVFLVLVGAFLLADWKMRHVEESDAQTPLLIENDNCAGLNPTLAAPEQEAGPSLRSG